MDTISLPQTLFTLQDLATLGGLVVAVYVIVSFFKEPLKNWSGDWIVRPFSVLIALIIMFWLVFVQGIASPETIGLAVINAFLVAMIAGAAHDYIVSPTKEKAAQKQIAAEQAQLDLIFENKDAAAQAAAIKAGDRGEEPPS
jgi:low affinity Fe/Cu permease